MEELIGIATPQKNGLLNKTNAIFSYYTNTSVGSKFYKIAKLEQGNVEFKLIADIVAMHAYHKDYAVATLIVVGGTFTGTGLPIRLLATGRSNEGSTTITNYLKVWYDESTREIYINLSGAVAYNIHIKSAEGKMTLYPYELSTLIQDLDTSKLTPIELV